MTDTRMALNLWVTLIAVWLIANASLDTQVVVTGLVLATLISLALSRFSNAYADIRVTPQVLIHSGLYLLVFAQELVRANLHVARLVFSPRIDIHPGIVEIKTRLRSRTGRMVLANSITLTPGTLVVDIDGDSLFVHWIDVEAEDLEGATRAIAERFERHLSVIYG